MRQGLTVRILGTTVVVSSIFAIAGCTHTPSNPESPDTADLSSSDPHARADRDVERPDPTVSPSTSPTPTAAVPTAIASDTVTPSPTTPAPVIKPPQTNPTQTSSKTTGVPSGTKLTRYDGDLVITEAGKIIDSLEVRGSISVRAPDVVIKNTRVIGVKALKTGLVSSRSTGLRIKDSEIYSTHRNPDSNGIMGSNFSLDGVEIRDVVDQVHIHGAGNVTIKDSWLHSNVHYAKDPNWNGKPSHDDNVQIVSGSNIKISGNRMSGAKNAAVMITQDDGKVANVLIEKNRLGNGGCSINISPGKNNPAISGLKVAKNSFDATQSVRGCAIIGPRSYVGMAQGNYWLATGALAPMSDGGY